METNELHRGRLIDHIQLVVRDLEASRTFYAAVFDVLGIPMAGEGGRHHLAFQAQDRAMVDRFHEVALAHGGKDNGAPGLRDYHPGYYGAFVLDPDGNNIEAVYHGEAKRSAPSVKVEF
ncbi:MAG: glyoxalase [Stenotrophomonas acidaminiphila]|nr:MAG: glyoxalase [Stenotrophomonas acidaminiphila]